MSERNAFNGGDAGSRANDGNAMTGVLGGDAVSGKVFAEAYKPEFNPIRESPMSGMEASLAPHVGGNSNNQFSSLKEAAPAPEANNKEYTAMLMGFGLKGQLQPGDTNYVSEEAKNKAFNNTIGRVLAA